jgi:hypothetical protein
MNGKITVECIAEISESKKITDSQSFTKKTKKLAIREEEQSKGNLSIPVWFSYRWCPKGAIALDSITNIYFYVNISAKVILCGNF